VVRASETRLALLCQERLHHERQAKKEALERQREAAKRAAVMHLPVQQKDAASGDSLAKLYARPPAAGASAFAAKPVESGSKALPRLKQAMEVRASSSSCAFRCIVLRSLFSLGLQKIFGKCA
jgi:hypothetical protein